MYRLWSQLVLYADADDSILAQTARLYRLWETGGAEKAELIHLFSAQVKRVLDLATEYGFDGNLWQNSLTYLMVTHPHSFALACERTGVRDGTIQRIACHDFSLFLSLFRFDFSPLENDLGVPLFSVLTDYQAVPKRERMYSRDISELVRALSARIAKAQDEREVFDLIADHYLRYGAHPFGMNRAFRVRREGALQLEPIRNIDRVTLDSLVGYDEQKAALRANMEAFVAGRPFNNTLLYGDAGTGKSTCVKAVLNEYWEKGLRVIELTKYQFILLSEVIAVIKTRPYRFVLLLDDLSFEDGDAEYKYLKAVIEGGLETRPDNVMICATSNRRHLIRESWTDRSDMEHDGDIHRSDTLEEKLSLAARFGCAIRFGAPDKALYDRIVVELAARHPEIRMDEEQLRYLAARWELRHGGLSGRTAQQFINSLAGQSAGG